MWSLLTIHLHVHLLVLSPYVFLRLRLPYRRLNTFLLLHFITTVTILTVVLRITVVPHNITIDPLFRLLQPNQTAGSQLFILSELDQTRPTSLAGPF